MYQSNKGYIEANQSVVTQELPPLEIFVEPAIKKEVVEPEIEIISNLNLELFTVKPEPSQDTDLVEEFQQQEYTEVNQDFVTQEPTSSEILIEAPFQTRTTDPEVELIPDVELGEDEQMHS